MTIVLMDGFINMVCELMANLEFHRKNFRQIFFFSTFD